MNLVLKCAIFTYFSIVHCQIDQQLLDKLVCIEHDECGSCLSAAPHCRWCADPYYSSSVPRCNDDFREIQQRSALRNNINPLAVNEREFVKRYRLNKAAFYYLCNKLREKMSLRSTKRVSLEHMVLCVLSFYATGSYQRIVGMAKYLGQTTVSKYFREVTNALNDREILREFIKFPTTRAERDIIRQNLVTSGCSQGLIQRPDKSVWEVMSNHSLQDMKPDSHEAVVQIQPQRIRLSLKPRETRKVKFTYRPAKNYPLDLYYLMDLTWSMKDDKETLVSLRDDLPNLLKNLTDNFRLGFGSFAEKPLMPFIYVDPRRKANPCSAEREHCEPTYCYRHHLSLTNQVSDFIEHVNSSSVTANLDNAEAQLDALVQVVACGEQVGWAPRSRKIVILLSDGLMHMAGDGKLGGATKKNDESCHLDNKGYYIDAGIYDYPSVAQVYRLLDKYKVNVIFAVTENVKTHYDQLHKLLADFTYVAKLESDSSNILKLVKTGYEDIVSVVDFEDDTALGAVKIKYFTDCGVKGGSMIETTRCTGVEYGMTLNYEAHVTLEACPEYKKLHQTVHISESQLGQDSLTLEVEVQCGCDCEQDLQPNLVLTCPVHSHLVCGVCQCNKGWSGPNCDCSIEDELASAALLSQCREPNVTHRLPCSGAGDCVCGRCACDAGFNGKYCQCRACEVSLINGIECGGVGHGVCACGACSCLAGWSGAACDCTSSVDACTPPGAAELCSAHGACVCGKCQCSSAEDGSKYSGAYCETCSNCENPMCTSTAPCVACHLNTTCTDACSIGNVNYTISERYNETEFNANEDPCILRLEENGLECEYKYTYTASSKDMVAMRIVLREKVCSEPTTAKLMPIALMIMASIVLGGLIIILFVKSAQIMADRRAYASFVKEAEESKMRTQELNPLYISPISEFRLPDAFPREYNHEF